MAERLPRVTALVAAYNYAGFLARTLDSALAQEYPRELLEIVVVDDGSTDDTPAIAREYARRHPDQVRCVRQENAGYVAATNRAMAEATGELWAMLDADDLWAPAKTARQVELFRGNPDLCAAYCDLEVIDPDDVVVQASFLRATSSPSLRGIGTLPTFLSWGNVATGSSVMVRADLGPLLHPIPAEMPYVDWWLAARAADVGAIDFVDEPLVGYRFHGANLTLHATGERLVREKVKAAAGRRCLIARSDLGALSPRQLLEAFAAVHRDAIGAVQAADSAYVSFPRPSAADAREAARLAERAERLGARGQAEAALAHWLRSWALDPFERAAHAAIVALRDRLLAGDAPTGALLDDARAFVTLVDADALLADERLLAAYAAVFDGADDATLVIDAGAMAADEIGERLGAAVERAGLNGHDAADLLAIGPGAADQRAQLVARADAVLTAEADVAALRALADEAIALVGRR